MADHLEPRRHVLEHLAHVLAEDLQLAAALGAVARRLMDLLLARQVLGQRPAHRLHALDPGGCGARQCRFARLEILERELELGDLRIELLRGAPELHPSQARQLQLQLLDLEIPRQQQRPLLAHQALQAVDIIG